MERLKAPIDELISNREAITRSNLELQQKMREIDLEPARRGDKHLKQKDGAVEQFVTDELTGLVEQKQKLFGDAKVWIERTAAYLECTERIFATGNMMNECLSNKQEELQALYKNLESSVHHYAQKRAHAEKEVEAEGIRLKELALETVHRLATIVDVRSEKINFVVSTLDQRMAHIGQSIDRKEQLFTEMSAEQKELETEIEQLQQLIRENEELKRQTLLKMESERKTATALMKKHDSVQRDVIKSEQLLSERQRDFVERKALMETTRAEVQQLEEQLAGLKEKVNQSSLELADLKELGTKLNADLTQMRQDDVKAIRQKTTEQKEILEQAEQKLAEATEKAEKCALEWDPSKLENYEKWKDIDEDTLITMLDEAQKREDAMKKEIEDKRAEHDQIIEKKRQILEKKAVLAQENKVAHNKLDEEVKLIRQELEERREYLMGEEEAKERKIHELRIAKDRLDAIKALEVSLKDQSSKKLAELNNQLKVERHNAQLIQSGIWSPKDIVNKMASGDGEGPEKKKRKNKKRDDETSRLGGSFPGNERLHDMDASLKTHSQPNAVVKMPDTQKGRPSLDKKIKKIQLAQGLVDSEDGDEVRPIPVVLPPDVEWANSQNVDSQSRYYGAGHNSKLLDAFISQRQTEGAAKEFSKGSEVNNFTDTQQASQFTVAPETVNGRNGMETQEHNESVVDETLDTDYDSYENSFNFSSKNSLDVEGRFPADIFLHTDPTKATRDPTVTRRDSSSSTERTANTSELEEASHRAVAHARRPKEADVFNDTIVTTQETIDDPFSDSD